MKLDDGGVQHKLHIRSLQKTHTSFPLNERRLQVQRLSRVKSLCNCDALVGLEGVEPSFVTALEAVAVANYAIGPNADQRTRTSTDLLLGQVPLPLGYVGLIPKKSLPRKTRDNV